VELFEWAQTLGGRLASMREPKSRQWIDNGQHILLGCCRETLELNERLGLTPFFDRADSISFVAGEGKRWEMTASPFLPHRWQLVPAFLKMPFLPFRDRVATGLLLRKLGKTQPGRMATPPEPTVLIDWLRREGASDASIAKFWTPLVLSTLSDTVETVCLQAVRKVVQDALLNGVQAISAHVPNRPLRSIYGEAAQEALERLDVRVHLGARVAKLLWQNYADEACTWPVDIDADVEPVACRIIGIELADGTKRSFNRYISTIPSHRIWRLLEDSGLESFADMLDLARFEPGAVTSVHLWCDRRILPGDKAFCATLGGPGQVLFAPAPGRIPAWSTEDQSTEGKTTENKETPLGVYHLVVISASHRLLSDSELTAAGNEPLIDRVLDQMRMVFPEAFERPGDPFRVLHWRTTTVFDAVFSPHPDIYAFRPSQATPIHNLAIAGDWTQTDWPSTMEGAVRSGLAAAELFPPENR
ncbi:MAG TPA: hypothetical protein DEB39_12595, partial [Planctomycetaceae bacterium]|nr:hypothetical protein [Planctomycetaceae bacterium]